MVKGGSFTPGWGTIWPRSTAPASSPPTSAGRNGRPPARSRRRSPPISRPPAKPAPVRSTIRRQVGPRPARLRSNRRDVGSRWGGPPGPRGSPWTRSLLQDGWYTHRNNAGVPAAQRRLISMAAQESPKRFSLVLIKPSHYDEDGYVIQWLRSAIPSNTLAVLNGLALDCRQRRVLGDDVAIDIQAFDETNTRIHPERIARHIARAGGRGLVALVGVQSNHYPRAMDIARRLRAAGVQVSIGGFHVSGCIAMLPDLPPELREAMDLGISLFAGEAEGRLETVLRDAWNGTLQPLYNYMDDLPSLEGVPIPILPAAQIKRTGGGITSFDAGRGCPFLCSFCTIINVQGRKSRRRSPDDIERIVRQNVAQGVQRFFVTDDNFSRNVDWEKILDRLIELRETQKLNIRFVIQVDTMCHRLPHLDRKSTRLNSSHLGISY